MTYDEFIAAGGVVEILDDTKEIRHIDLHTYNRAQFGNLPPKTVHIPPRQPKRKQYRMRVTRDEA